MNRLLREILQELGLDPDIPPDPATWQSFLDRLDQTHQEHEERQNILDRSAKKHQARFEILLEALPVPIFRLTANDGSIIALNAAFESLIGWPRDHWLGEAFISLCHDSDKTTAVAALHSVLVGGEETTPFEVRLRTAGGEEVNAEIFFSPHIENGRMTQILGVAYNVTSRKWVEQDLRAAMESAQSANQSKSAFLANMSHEIRTPMNAIIGMTGLLLDTELAERQIDYVETIRAGSDTLLALINDILDFSKIESGKLELERQPFDLRECVEAAISLAGTVASQKGLPLRTEIDPTCPPAIVGDVTRVRQVLVNLLSNAVKFTEKGEVVVRVRSRPLHNGQSEIRFEIADTGIGIPEERLETIFESFHQVDASTTRKYGGTGLGLTISKSLTELMDGDIGATSTEGEGSVFFFTVPAEALDAVPEEHSGHRDRVEIDSRLAERLPLRILVAEDNVVNQKVAQLLLKRLGYRADVVANGAEVLDALRRQTYDLVLMDVQMPELDGLEATRRLRREGSKNGVPWIVAMTAGALVGDRERCRAAGMNDYVAKPVEIHELQAAIERFARRRP